MKSIPDDIWQKLEDASKALYESMNKANESFNKLNEFLYNLYK